MFHPKLSRLLVWRTYALAVRVEVMTGTHRNKQWFSHGLVGKTFSKNALGKTPGGPSTGVKLTYDMIAGTPCGSGIPFYRGGTAVKRLSLFLWKLPWSLIATLYRGMLRGNNESDCRLTPFFRQIDDRKIFGIYRDSPYDVDGPTDFPFMCLPDSQRSQHRTCGRQCNRSFGAGSLKNIAKIYVQIFCSYKHV